MSVTSGVVSRIEVTSYVHGSSELLGVQIDAAINAGNSGADPRTVNMVGLVERAGSCYVSRCLHLHSVGVGSHCQSTRLCYCTAIPSLCACRGPRLHKSRRVLRHRVPEPAGALAHAPPVPAWDCVREIGVLFLRLIFMLVAWNQCWE